MTKPILLRCSCGQVNWIPGYGFNRPEALKFGSPYRCAKCRQVLGGQHFMPGQVELVDGANIR